MIAGIKTIFQKSKSIKGLDGLRGICVVAVLTDHAGLSHYIESGTLAVWIFFALSGFLIVPIFFNSRLRVEAGTSDAMREVVLFARDRALRIFPVYYVALAIALVLGLTFGSPENIDKLQGSLTWLLTYTTNIYIGFVRHAWLGPLSHLWTLAVEQQFYVLFPLVFIFIPARRWIMALVLSSVALIAASLLFFFHDELAFRVNSLSGFYAICLGGLCGLAAKNRTLPAARFPSAALLAIAGALILQHVCFTLTGRTGISLLIAPPLSALLILMITLNQSSAVVRFLELPLIRGVGVVSYGFYLFHGFLLGPSGRVVVMLTGLTSGLTYQLLQIACAFLVTMVVSIVSFLYFEQKFMELKKRRPAHALATETGRNSR